MQPDSTRPRHATEFPHHVPIGDWEEREQDVLYRTTHVCLRSICMCKEKPWQSDLFSVGAGAPPTPAAGEESG